MNYYEIKAGSLPNRAVPGQCFMGGSNPKGDRIEMNHYYLLMNGKPFFPISGEFHFSRYPYSDWEEEIIKMKLAGINVIPTYIFWIYHEEEESCFDWTGCNNLRYFVDLCAKQKMNVILRIGPFSHGECRNGGFPDWLYGKPFQVRSNDPGYLFYVKRFFQAIFVQVAGQLFKDGGPIIGIQLENEFTASSAKWELTALQSDEWIPSGSGGVEHMRILKSLALEAGFDVPLFTCTAWGKAPVVDNEILPMWGGYAFQPWILYWNRQKRELPPTDNYIFRDYHRNHSHYLDASYPTAQYPFACCEIGGGMQTWYNCRFVVPPESVEALAINRLAGGCNFIGYYMFHGGSAPIGKHSYLNERPVPKISYDFQAPLGEFGQVNDSYRYLKLLHLFLRDFQETLCPMVTVLPEGAEQITPTDIDTLRFAARVTDNSGFLFFTNYQDHLTTKDHQNIQICLELPAEKLTVPEKTGLNLKKDISAILPFNIDLDGVLLKYATAQLVTKIVINEEAYYFFFAPEAMASEFCFAASTCHEVKTDKGPLPVDGQRYYVLAEPGTHCGMTLTSCTGKKIHIITLTRKQALGMWKVNLGGQERIILTEATLINGDGYLKLHQTESPAFSFDIFPQIEGEHFWGNGTPMPVTPQGIFSRYSLTLPHQNLNLKWQKSGPGKAVVQVAPGALNGLAELFLAVDYTGDVGNAYLGNHLIHDNFYNGQTWEIGLKRFYPEVTEQDLYLSISPLCNGSVVYTDAALGIKANFEGKETAEIHSIRLVPQYQMTITIQRNET